MDGKPSGRNRRVLESLTDGGPLNRRRFLASVGAATIIDSSTVSASEGFTKETYTLESYDGTKLVARFFEPDGMSATDYIVPAGWSFTVNESKSVAHELVKESNKVVLYDQRGYGRSNGRRDENMDRLTGVKDYVSITTFFVENGNIERNPTLKVFN